MYRIRVEHSPEEYQSLGGNRVSATSQESGETFHLAYRDDRYYCDVVAHWLEELQELPEPARKATITALSRVLGV